MLELRKWIEVILMPLVVAAIGIIGTHTIAVQQAENAKLSRKTELEKAQEIAYSDRQIKIVEIFSDKITSKNEQERILALNLLTILDGDLAKKLAIAVSKSEPENTEINETVNMIVENSNLQGSSFPVVFSTKDYNVAVKFSNDLVNNGVKYTPKIYLSENGYFAVTLGGYLSIKEARKRVAFAVSENISIDSYIRTSNNWGDNLL